MPRHLLVGDEHIGRIDALSRRRKTAMLGVIGCSLATLLLLVGGDEEKRSFVIGVFANNKESLVESLMESQQPSLADGLAQAGFVVGSEETMPNWFSEEIIDLGICYEGFAPDEVMASNKVIATEDWSLVRVAWDKPIEEVRAILSAGFIAKGWVNASKDESGNETFMKEKGSCQWLAIAYAEEGNATSTVMHIQHS